VSPSRPLVISITELQRRPGSRREVTRSVELDGLAISTASVPEGGEIQVAVVVESLGDDVAVEGRVTAPFVGDCRRCLTEVRGEVSADVREIFQKHFVDGETYPLVGEHIDLEPVVRDAVLLALPLAPLCREDCRGPAPDEFPATVEGEPLPGDPDPDLDPADPDAAEAPRDPRWAALDQLDLD
jgi:uncharacterized protein